MDNKEGPRPASGGTGTDPREELREQLQVMGKAAGELLEQLVKVPATLAQIPLQALPEDTSTHARNAANEGFAAVRTLLDGMSRGIDQLMKEQRERMANMGSTRTGVGGTSSTTPPPASGTESHTRALGSGGAEAGSTGPTPTEYLGGHGPGAGPSGTGDADDTHGAGGAHTIRLDDEP